jgi:hypothetical protein
MPPNPSALPTPNGLGHQVSSPLPFSTLPSERLLRIARNMADWKTAEEQEYRDFLYIEEVNSNDGSSRRLTGITTSQTVQDLKKLVAAELQNPQGWSSVLVAFADKELSDRESIVLNTEYAHIKIVQSTRPSLLMGYKM